jgi:pimeloyl-ACP methyl ester carboxylesterase
MSVAQEGKNNRPRTVACSILMALHGGLALLLLYLPWLLCVHAETAGGHLTGGGFLLLGVCPFPVWWRVLGGSWRHAAGLASAIFGAAVLCLLTAYALSPTGETSGGALSSRFSGDAHFHRASLSNIVPEIDQLKLGSYLFAHLDPFIDDEQGERVRELFLDVYLELRNDDGLRSAGSALGFCYRDIFLNRRTTLHFYEYVPRHLGRKTYPVLVFLHGSLGNFKGYIWVLKRVADQAGVALICPTFGAGNWDRDPECTVIDQVHQYVKSVPEFDSSNMVLSGLSNGGKGVTRAMAKRGQLWRGAIAISPVLESEVMAKPGFLEQADRIPILIIHGESDRRIPLGYVNEHEQELRQAGFDVTTYYYPSKDHFLLFSQPGEVTDQIVAWLEARNVPEYR